MMDRRHEALGLKHVTPSLAKLKLYKTAWSPRLESYVGIEEVIVHTIDGVPRETSFDDIDTDIELKCRLPDLDRSVWFLPSDLIRYCL